MRHFDASGQLARSTSQAANWKGVSETDVNDPRRLAEALRELQARLAKLEAKTPPEAAEYVLDVGTAGAISSVYHGFDSAVRWTITHWSGPNVTYQLVEDSSSDRNYLNLRSYQAGRAVVRIEPSQHGVF